MFDILTYPFMQRAIAAGMILALALAMLGTFVLLRRMAFFADGIAHASLAGIAVGIVFSFYPLAAALIISALFALLIYFIEKKLKIASDIAIGILFTAGMSLGILIISLQPGYQPELLSFLFGNILSIEFFEIILIGAITLGIIFFVAKYYSQLILISLDEETAHVSGVKLNILLPLFYVILAVTTVLGIKILGVVLVSALLILPSATARLAASTFKGFFILSIVLSEIMVLAGIFLSFFLDWPTGPVIVLTGTLLFILFLLWSMVNKKNG